MEGLKRIVHDINANQSEFRRLYNLALTPITPKEVNYTKWRDEIIERMKYNWDLMGAAMEIARTNIALRQMVDEIIINEGIDYRTLNL